MGDKIIAWKASVGGSGMKFVKWNNPEREKNTRLVLYT